MLLLSLITRRKLLLLCPLSDVVPQGSNDALKYAVIVILSGYCLSAPIAVPAVYIMNYLCPLKHCVHEFESQSRHGRLCAFNRYLFWPVCG
jgi:hypothetical protein